VRTSVELQLLRAQLMCAAKVMDLFDKQRRETLSRPGRPSCSACDKPDEWWRYSPMCMIIIVIKIMIMILILFFLNRDYQSC
jgi:hypothetical protein